MRRRLLAIIPLLALPLLGLVVATSASAQTAASVDVTSATQVAKGAAVDVELTVTCEAGSDGFVRTAIAQRFGSRMAQGNVSVFFPCTGEPQTLTLRVTTSSGSAPFKQGTALIDAYLQACNPIECQFADTSETFRIR